MCASWDCRLTWLYEWQTLVAGSAALIAAYIAKKAVQSQIEQADRHMKEQRGRRFIAARATMPLTLSDMCAYAETTASRLQAFRKALSGTSPGAAAFHPAKLPSASISALEHVIEYADDNPALVLALQRILSNVQLLHARTSSLTRTRRIHQLNAGVTAEERLLDCALVQAGAGLLFPFARLRTEEVTDGLGWPEIHNALLNLDIDVSAFPHLAEVMKLAAEHGKSPSDW